MTRLTDRRLVLSAKKTSLVPRFYAVERGNEQPPLVSYCA
jgi:hypothetical protein